MDRDELAPPGLPAEPGAMGYGSFVEGVQVEVFRLAQRLGTSRVTLDMTFLAYLLKASHFGFFTFGPVTIDVRLIEDIVERTTPRIDPDDRGTMADDTARFADILTRVARESGRRRIDELTYLLAFMRCGEGLPARVFGELGVTGADVEAYAEGRSFGTDPRQPAEAERLYSPEEAAEHFGVHVQTVRSWIRAGRLTASRLAGQRALRIRASDLESVLEPVDPTDA